MADGGEIASLFATLGLKVNAGQWAQGTAAIQGSQRAVAGLNGTFTDAQGRWRAASGRFLTMTEKMQMGLAGVGEAAEKAGRSGAGWFGRLGNSLAEAGQRAAATGTLLGGVLLYAGERMVKSGVEFNATLEDSKNKVAGLMALAKNTDFNAELANAGVLMTNLEKAAAKLPGETSDYVNMLSLIAQPVSQAKLGLKELEQLTISATSTALTMKIDPGQAARDIEGALNGVFNSRDRFTGPLLGARGFTGEEGRSRFNALDAKDRAKEVMAAFNAPQLQAMGAALGKSFSGVLSTLEDAWHRFERAIAKPLFEKLSVQIAQANEWLDAHAEKIAEVAEQIGTVLSTAFDIVIGALNFFREHADLTIAILIAIGTVLAGLAVMWIAGFWPIFLVIAAIAALVYGIRKLMDYPGGLKQAFSDAWGAIKQGAEDLFDAIMDGISGVFEYIEDLPPIKALMELVDKLEKFAGLGGTPSKEQAKDIENKAVPANVMLRDLDTMAPEDFRKKYPWLPAVEGGGQRRGPGNGDPELQPDRPAPFAPTAPVGPSAAGGVSIGQVNVGDITVHSPNADPVAVGDQVRKVFHEELGNTLRKTKDMYG